LGHRLETVFALLPDFAASRTDPIEVRDIDIT